MFRSYSQKFYLQRKEQKEAAARLILDLVLPELPPVRSAVDFGCGIGIWLAELSTRGIDVLGLDGPWVDQDELSVPARYFRRTNLAERVDLERRFDLAVSLEVAEHVTAAQADSFVDNLTRAADVILFSAAIPGQGGTHHFNEQWPSYWRSRFAARGFEIADLIRHAVWDDVRIPYWYRQNMFVYARTTSLPSHATRLKDAIAIGPRGPLDIVHPELFRNKSRRGWKTLFRS
jgi:cyclopropane fatty-acyl-phospholipid synthase-like methyltransferase